MNSPFSIDLHTHLRGTLSPALVRELARENSVHVPQSAFGPGGSFRYDGFEEFLSVYDQIGKVIQRPENLERITAEYLIRCGQEGTRYVELMLSPDHSEDNGVPYNEQFDSVAEGIARARARTGIEATVVATAVRHRGPQAALGMAERLSTLRHPVVSGFGLTGNEMRFDIREFSGAFYVAQLAGLGCTAHVGEWSDARSVLRAVDELSLTRVGHGLSIVQDRAILDELSARQVAFEICLSSNQKLRRCRHLDEHPAVAMLDAGCRVTLATDDPAYFDTTPAREYAIANEVLGLSSEQLSSISLNAIESAFCSEDIKGRLRNALSKCQIGPKASPAAD